MGFRGSRKQGAGTFDLTPRKISSKSRFTRGRFGESDLLNSFWECGGFFLPDVGRPPFRRSFLPLTFPGPRERGCRRLASGDGTARETEQGHLPRLKGRIVFPPCASGPQKNRWPAL